MGKRWRNKSRRPDAEDAKVSQRTQKNSTHFDLTSASSASFCVLCVRLLVCMNLVYLSLGFSASRNQSPSRFTESAINTSITPGKMVIHHSPENR